ncbi:MAG: biotin--[acetyl-CoA-carboxylase] ligase [Betaproteobacteria bacterium RIFCSPLOWO2_12_FULL_63_13]|nr:MAG: biotin--[acetyl-CoA-carboxylase] ligase [Betaproteobacteria bacterium RIFCSPLOWO2_12_FULL_63_13]
MTLPPDFAEAIDRARPRLGRLASSVRFFSTIGSTNDAASALAGGGGAEGAVVIADAQTMGRGRRGRRWHSPPGSGLYVALVLTPARAKVAPTRATGLVTLAAGVALAEAIETATGLRPDIKWPNDLLAGPRKVAGILAEAVGGPSTAIESVVLGYGINVGPMAFDPDLADRATSLESELCRPIDRAMLCAETLAACATRYDDLLEGRFDAILDAWRDRAPASRGAAVAWDTPAGQQSGITAGIDDDGALLVRAGDRVERIVGGEISWLRSSSSQFSAFSFQLRGSSE